MAPRCQDHDPPRPAAADLRATLLTCGPIVAGLAFMYGPSFVDLFRGIWSTDAQAHGPIVFGVSCWLVWRNWPAMWARSEGAQTSAAGWPVVVVGLLLYIVGRSQEIPIFEIGSLIWLLTGILLLMRGGGAVKAQWFALFFMLFMIPLPQQIVDAVTMPMKMAASYAAENIRFAGKIPDGLLFRVSSIDPEALRAYDLQANFSNQLLGAVTPEQRQRLAGSFGKT